MISIFVMFIYFIVMESKSMIIFSSAVNEWGNEVIWGMGFVGNIFFLLRLKSAWGYGERGWQSVVWG